VEAGTRQEEADEKTRLIGPGTRLFPTRHFVNYIVALFSADSQRDCIVARLFGRQLDVQTVLAAIPFEL
jgi:hypothetical protein